MILKILLDSVVDSIDAALDPIRSNRCLDKKDRSFDRQSESIIFWNLYLLINIIKIK